MTEKIREIPPMPTKVAEHRQQQHNLLYQIKFAVEDMVEENSKAHEELFAVQGKIRRHNNKQDVRIFIGALALLVITCGIAYIHSGLTWAGIIAGASSSIGVALKLKGLL